MTDFSNMINKFNIKTNKFLPVEFYIDNVLIKDINQFKKDNPDKFDSSFPTYEEYMNAQNKYSNFLGTHKIKVDGKEIFLVPL